MAAKHIVIAKTEGVEAGFDAYLKAPSSRLSPNYAEIMKRRTPHTRLQAYCNIFAEKIGKVRPNRATVAATQDDVQTIMESLNEGEPTKADLLNAVTRLTALLSGDEDDEDEPENVAVLSTSTDFITAHVAWVLLGSDPDKRPGQKNPERLALPATSGQMYSLNANGFFSAITEALNAQAEAAL